MENDYTAEQVFKKGDRVELHPGTDVAAMGARYGEVDSVQGNRVRIKLDRAKFLRVSKEQIRHLATYHYTVIVGNIGLVYDGFILEEAMDAYRYYSLQSEEGGKWSQEHRAAGENVTVMKDQDIFKEYVGKNERLQS